MDASPYNRDTIATFLSDSIGQTGRGVKKPAHETYTDRIDFAFLYEVGHSVKIRGIVGSVKRNSRTECPRVAAKSECASSPRLSVLLIREMSKAERSVAMTNSFQQGLIIASRLPINLLDCGAHITTMALHGKCFFTGHTCMPPLALHRANLPTLDKHKPFPRIHNQCARATFAHQPAGYC